MTKIIDYLYLLARLLWALPRVKRVSDRCALWSFRSKLNLQDRIDATPGARQEFDAIKKWITQPWHDRAEKKRIADGTQSPSTPH